MPVEEVPSELPEPCLGINYARDGMQRRDWLALVAVHSDSWLMAVAFFYAVKLDAAGRCVMLARKIFDLTLVRNAYLYYRLRLFKLINQHQTLFEVVTNKKKTLPKKPKVGNR